DLDLGAEQGQTIRSGIVALHEEVGREGVLAGLFSFRPREVRAWEDREKDQAQPPGEASSRHVPLLSVGRSGGAQGECPTRPLARLMGALGLGARGAGGEGPNVVPETRVRVRANTATSPESSDRLEIYLGALRSIPSHPRRTP